MKPLLIFLLLNISCMSSSNQTSDRSATNTVTTSEQKTLYDFSKEGRGKWRIQNDVVMGGRSNSQLKITEENYAHFSGEVSLENNGGFCSIHQTIEDNPYTMSDQLSAFILKIKADGKDYSFRVRTPNGRHLYGYTFSTSSDEEWETIVIPFSEMEAKFHGEPVDVPNYAGEEVVEMQLLIGNGKAQNFEVLIKEIGVR